MIRPSFRALVVACLATLVGLSAGAQTVGNRQFSTVQDAIAALGTELYQELDPNYTESSAADITFTVGARKLVLGYLRSESGEIVVFEGESELQAFDGETRTDAERELMAYLRQIFDQDPTSLRIEVQNTPNDPVSGTPVSLQARMAGAAFDNGSDVGPGARTGGSRARGTLSARHLGLSLQSGRYSGPGFSASINTTPLSYSIPFDDPRWALKIDLPISFAVINGVENVSASLGVGLRMPVYDNWTLTPELRLGVTRNRTRKVTAKLLNASVISNYRIPLRNGHSLTIGNSLTYSTTFGSAYDQENVIGKNGIEISGPTRARLFGLPTTWEASVVHTKVGGDATYIDEWVDVSFSLGTIGSKNNVTWDSVRVGITYTRASRGVEGININFGYEF